MLFPQFRFLVRPIQINITNQRDNQSLWENLRFHELMS